MEIGQQSNFIVINKQANSLYSLITDGQYRTPSLRRSTWKTLMGSQASLQYNCNKEGFNAVCNSYLRARIGILSNDENVCTTCDSRIGFGIGTLVETWQCMVVIMGTKTSRPWIHPSSVTRTLYDAALSKKLLTAQ